MLFGLVVGVSLPTLRQSLPIWAQLLVGAVLMDLSFYYWHRINHSIGLLWRFHSVHHVDPDMDVTTSFRFHWGETLYSSVFRAVWRAVRP